MCFEVLELALGEVKSRFGQTDYRIVKSLENLLLNAANGEILKPEQSLFTYLEHHTDMEELVIQWHMITDMIKNAFQSLPINYLIEQ